MDMYSIPLAYYLIGIVGLFAVYLFFDQIKAGMARHEFIHAYRPTNLFFISKGQMRKVKELQYQQRELVEEDEPVLDENGNALNPRIMFALDAVAVTYSDDTTETLPISRIRPHALVSLTGGWNDNKIYYVKEEFKEEHYSAVISDLRKELATLRSENASLAKASLLAVKDMSLEIGAIAKSVRPNIILSGKGGHSQFGGGGEGGGEG